MYIMSHKKVDIFIPIYKGIKDQRYMGVKEEKMKISVSIPDDQYETIVKDAKKKAIDEGISLSEAIVNLLELWVKGKAQIKGKK